jgi:hypothetical protein
VDVLWCSFGAMSLAAGAQVGANIWLFAIVFLGVVVPFYIVTWESCARRHPLCRRAR